MDGSDLVIQDVWDEIIDYLDDHRDLRSSALVYRAFVSPAQTLLFRSIRILERLGSPTYNDTEYWNRDRLEIAADRLVKFAFPSSYQSRSRLVCRQVRCRDSRADCPDPVVSCARNLPLRSISWPSSFLSQHCRNLHSEPFTGSPKNCATFWEDVTQEFVASDFGTIGF
jgi:hypothetical protein